MAAKNSSLTDKPFFLWLLANMLGFGVLGFVQLVFPKSISQLSALESAFLISLPVSLAQWLALRRLGPVSWLWIIALPLGQLVSIQVARNIPDGLWLFLDDESPIVLTALYLVGGILIGLPQWVLLQSRFPRAYLWIPGTAGGLGLGAAVLLGTNLINFSGILSYVVAVLVYATVTGIVFSRWLVRPGSPRRVLPTASALPPSIQ